MGAEEHRIHQAVNGAENVTYYKFSPRESSSGEEEHIRSWSHQGDWVILVAPAALEIEPCYYCSNYEDHSLP